MIRNITLSADEQLIARAREEAQRRGTTLNEEFRRWLVAFSEQDRATSEFRELMERLSYASVEDPADIPTGRMTTGWDADPVAE